MLSSDSPCPPPNPPKIEEISGVRQITFRKWAQQINLPRNQLIQWEAGFCQIVNCRAKKDYVGCQEKTLIYIAGDYKV